MDFEDFVNIRTIYNSCIGENNYNNINGICQKGINASFRNGQIKIDGNLVATFSGKIDIINNIVYDIQGNIIVDLNNP